MEKEQFDKLSGWFQQEVEFMPEAARPTTQLTHIEQQIEQVQTQKEKWLEWDITEKDSATEVRILRMNDVFIAGMNTVYKAAQKETK